MFKIGKLSGPLHSAAAGPLHSAAAVPAGPVMLPPILIFTGCSIYRTDQYFQHFETFAKY